MHRSLAFALVLLLAAAIAGFWLFFRGDTAPPVPSGPTPTTEVETAAAKGETAPTRVTAAAADLRREVASVRKSSAFDDPEFVAGLTGFKGRVVDHDKAPVADCGVRIYRGALDAVLTEGLDVFADQSAFTPDYVAGEAQTSTDGTFLITQVRPNGFYVLFAGIGTDAPMHQLVTRIPSPGEIVDLGDIALPDAGVITGTVLDDDGEPLAGALVRAADLPGSLAAFFPVERFDPKGALLVREARARMDVVEMPAWVETAFEQLPIPSTRTDGDGGFRLVGVVPGSNLLATTMRGFLSDMKPSIQVRAGQVKDVGRIRLKRGEELNGRVVDAAGKPVPGAEVYAGSTISVAPVDLAQRLDPTDADGHFHGEGFAAGKVTVAARRGKGHAWVLADPQPVFGDVVVQLPAMFAVTASVALPDGTPAPQPRLRVLRGKAGEGAAEMHMLGFAPPLDLSERLQRLEDGRWRIDNLNPGPYSLIADVPGYATAFTDFELKVADAEVALALTAPNVFHVVVVDPEDHPVRNATIFAEARGKRLVEMPVNCGRTGADGRLDIDRLTGDSLRVSAEHPRWGIVHGETKPGEELRLVMQVPGSLRGLVLENGKAPTPGKFSVVCMRERGDGPRGPLENVPGLVSPGIDGSFVVKALQPGTYDLIAIDSLDTLHSPGALFALSQNAFMMRDPHTVEIEIAAGQEQQVTIEAGEQPIEGPTANLLGSVTVNGRLAVDHMVTAYAQSRRFSAKVDARGRFDLGVLPAGNVWFAVHASPEAGMFMGPGGNLWSSSLSLQPAETRELTIDVTTTSLSGVCVDPDGAPAPGVFVQAQGRLKGNADEGGNVWLSTRSDAQGTFRFDIVPEGVYSLTVRGFQGRKMRGKLDDLQVMGSLPIDSLRLELRDAMPVKGRVDLRAFEQRKIDGTWLMFFHLAADTKDGDVGDYANGAGVNRKDATFSTEELAPGRYRVRLNVSFEGSDNDEQYECGDLDVPAGGLQDLVLQPGKRLN